jgi:acetolactate synthase-1/2/3 large subunit
MMNLQELQTIRHYGLPVSIIIFSNDGYGALRQTFKNFFDGKEIGCTPATGVSFPDFSQLARVFGFEYRLCDCNAGVDEALGWVFDNDGVCILEVLEQLDDPTVPRLESKITADGSMTSPELFDMCPYVSQSEMETIMSPMRTGMIE